ncbi:MAG: DUF4396 domain-containing protein [Bacteroidetes bacterium]|nr:DUF4396 domain-containing protein [Bacteroidota bacterium]
MISGTIDTIAWLSIAVCVICALIIAADVIRHPQMMAVMNVVWPATALYSGPLALIAYYTLGRSPNGRQDHHAASPMWQSVLKGALHCGSGCTLGDIAAAGFLLAVPLTLWGSKLAADWTVEYVAAFVLGIIFQYYAIKPMKQQLTSGQALVAALKADALSLTCWQVGMYGWMAISNFLIFHQLLKASQPIFWLMMQIGMLCGLLTAYPVNWWLIKKGIKETM